MGCSNIIGEIEGTIVGAANYLDYPGLQILSYESDGVVKVWVEVAAR